MMQFLWLGTVVNQQALHQLPVVSPAANRWQGGLITGLQNAGVECFLIGHLPEPLWPRGSLRVDSNVNVLENTIAGSLTSYWNIPIWRDRSLSQGYRKDIDKIYRSNNASATVSYNVSPASTKVARYLRDEYGVPWISIVADDFAPPDANAYVFLAWEYYRSFPSTNPKLHLDGGVNKIRFSPQDGTENSAEAKPIVMYTGTMSKYGGVSMLARAFSKLDNEDAELWICGKGVNKELDRLAQMDRRIQNMQFVSEERLIQLSQQTTIFVNPRPSNVIGNERNFPSKVLEYLSYGKPVISTWTPGLSPEYRDVLIVLNEETEECLTRTLDDTLSWNEKQRELKATQIEIFLRTSRLWETQSIRLLEWIKREVLLT